MLNELKPKRYKRLFEEFDFHGKLLAKQARNKYAENLKKKGCKDIQKGQFSKYGGFGGEIYWVTYNKGSCNKPIKRKKS